MELALIDPKQTIFLLQKAESLIEKEALGQAIRVHRVLGEARLVLGDIEEAQSYFKHCLELLTQWPNTSEEIVCRDYLGRIAVRAGDFQSAYEEFAIVIERIENQRLSVTDADQRVFFLQKQLEIYTTFIQVCIYLHRWKEALETVEKIKSRVLADLLAQPVRKPIDYSLLREVQELDAEREQWIRTYALFRERLRYFF